MSIINKPSKKKFLVINEKYLKKLSKNFVESYPYASWLYKIEILNRILDNWDKYENDFLFKDIITKKPIESDSIKRTIKSEIYFTFFHITEALFALIYSSHVKNSQPILVSLNTYESKKLNKFIRKIGEEVLNFTDSELLSMFFALNEKALDIEGEHGNAIRETIKFLKEYLPKLATEYLKSKPIYNSYKHGLRIVQGDMKINAVSNESNEIIQTLNNDIHIYLKFKKIKSEGDKEFFKILQISRSFDYKRALTLSKINYRIIQNTFFSRRQINNKQDKIAFIPINDIQINKLFPCPDVEVESQF